MVIIAAITWIISIMTIAVLTIKLASIELNQADNNDENFENDIIKSKSEENKIIICNKK